jgi:hypothetical protein
MNLKVHHRGQDEKSIRTKHTVDFIDRLLRIGEVLKGFEVQYQSNASIGNRLHIRNITDNVNAGWIEVRHILLDIPFSWKEGSVKIWLPSRARIEDGFLKGETPNRPFYIVDNRLSQ